MPRAEMGVLLRHRQGGMPQYALQGQAFADPSPIEPDVYLIPAGCIEVPPPAPVENKVAVWCGGKWQLVDLYQGVKAAKQSMTGQLSVLEGYAADSSPMGDLAALATRKAQQQQQRNDQLEELKALLTGGSPDVSMRARLIGPGNSSELRRQLLAGDAPGHEWVLCAGVILVGSKEGLSFVQELVGL